MGSLTEIVYSPLVEEAESLTGWSKATVDYALSHKDSICTVIRGTSKYRGRTLDASDVDDLYMEVLDYMYHAEDYNLNKAYSSKCDYDSFVSLAGYVHSCAKFITLRVLTGMREYESQIVHETVTGSDGKELSLLDTKPDNESINKLEELSGSLKEICEMYEHARYKYGTDIFAVWYIRLKTMDCGKQDSFKTILKSIGISKHSINSIPRGSSIMLDIAKAITLEESTAHALSVLAEFTYATEIIDKVIKSC